MLPKHGILGKTDLTQKFGHILFPPTKTLIFPANKAAPQGAPWPIPTFPLSSILRVLGWPFRKYQALIPNPMSWNTGTVTARRFPQ